MCKCNPNIRTPFCGKGDCQWPEQKNNIREIFEKHREEYLNFDAVKNQKSGRPDLHAFLLLDELFPGNRNMISALRLLQVLSGGINNTNETIVYGEEDIEE